MAENSSRWRQKRQSGKQLPPKDDSDDDKINDPDYEIRWSRRHSKLDPPIISSSPINGTHQEAAQHQASDVVPNVRRKCGCFARKENSEKCDEEAAAASTQIEGCKPQQKRRGRSRGNSKKPSSENVRQMMKPATILSWLIDYKTVEENGEVMIINQEMIITKGKIKREGILYCCCSKILTAEEFHVHCGGGGGTLSNQKPYNRILVVVAGSRKSLMSCIKETLRHPSQCDSRETKFIINTSADDAHDYVCILCANGGDLLCCDNCSSTYHQSCLDITMRIRIFFSFYLSLSPANCFLKLI